MRNNYTKCIICSSDMDIGEVCCLSCYEEVCNESFTLPKVILYCEKQKYPEIIKYIYRIAMERDDL